MQMFVFMLASCYITKVIELFCLQSSQNILYTVSQVAPSILSLVMSHLTACLENAEFEQVTVDEYAILKTQEGEVYYKSVLERWVKTDR